MSRTEDEAEDIPIDDEEEEEEEGDMEEEIEEEYTVEEEPSIYDPNDFISWPKLSGNSTIPTDILDFDFSYGYSCRKYFNLCVIDENTIVFGSGNYIHFFDIEKKNIWFRRSALGGGIGHVRKNPNPEYSHLAVAESGEKPIIIIYEWPEMEIFCVLREGATKCYTNMDYSPDGMLLCSQGGEPDYLITVWNWPSRRILLRTKSYVNDVFRVKFSPYVPGQLTTCGVAHIKFWKMAVTFTGLKLKGELGRFGKTEYSDIVGVLPMPDEKVVSGCFWGNILIWEDGLIKLEVCRTQRKRCHDAPIVQLYYNEGELWTVSMDGHVKVWWYEKIDQADPPDDDRVVLVEPTYDFCTKGVMLMYIEKRYANIENTLYIGQDGNGGLWEIDLNTEVEPKPPVQLYSCHGGEIMDIAACPYDHYLVSFGKDGKLFLYDYHIKERVFQFNFEAKGGCLIWLPVEIHRTGDEIIAGFEDGQLRVCILQIHFKDAIKLKIVQVIKPHNKPVVKISVNNTGKILISAGEDSTIFIFKMEFEEDKLITHLVPIGFIPTPDIVTCITWHLNNDATVLLGCEHGHIMQVEVPYEPQDYTEVSFLLHIKPKLNRFKTYKAQIRRNIKVAEIHARKMAKLEQKKKKLEEVKKENPGLSINEEVFLADSESEEELEPLHIPEVPNKVLWLKYIPTGTIWLSMGGYDAGYIYEYFIDQMDTKPYKFKKIDDGDDIEISSYVYSHLQQYLIFAMQDGSIRVNKVNPLDFTDLKDYWIFTMHDNFNGFVPKMCFSFDEKYFFSSGHDGNVFAYKFQPVNYIKKKLYEIRTPAHRDNVVEGINDFSGYDKLSLEELKIKAEQDRINKVANMRKAHLRDIIKEMQHVYENLLERNTKLLPSQIIPREELEIDPRITDYINQQFEDKLALVKRKLAYDVEKSTVRLQKLRRFLIESLDLFPITVKAINENETVSSLRQRKLPDNLEEIKAMIEKKLKEEEDKGRPLQRTVQVTDVEEPIKEIFIEKEYFLLSLSESTIQTKLGPKLNRMLQNYRRRILKWKKRAVEWEKFNATKPLPNVNHPADEEAYTTAKAHIGDYVLKTSEDYHVPSHLKETTTKKYKQVTECREKLFNLKHDVSVKVYKLRDEKYKIIDYIAKQEKNLANIHNEIPTEFRKFSPNILKYDPSEFPEKAFEVIVDMPTDETTILADEILDPDIQLFVKAPTYDQIEHNIIPNRSTFPQQNKNGYYDLIEEDTLLKNISDAPFDQLVKHGKNEEVDTVYEKELRIWRLNRKLVEQEEVIKHINMSIENFNKKLKDLNVEIMHVLIRANVLELHILTLNQELIVLKNFEAKEYELENTVSANNTVVLDMKDFIMNVKTKISAINKNIEENQQRLEVNYESFFQAANNNKFYDFLRKVFKKKYRAPKVHTDDDSSSDSSSSSSSDSEEDDGASIDSRDFNFIKQDLNVCPKGCEQAIYDYTINLRTKRYEIEQAIKECEKANEFNKKELEVYMKKLFQKENILKLSQDELVKYQREKQRILNTIMCTVLLNVSQIQLFTEENKTYNFEDTVIISKDTLTNLYKRVGQLHRENISERNKHEKADAAHYPSDSDIPEDLHKGAANDSNEGDEEDIEKPSSNCVKNVFTIIRKFSFIEENTPNMFFNILEQMEDYCLQQSKKKYKQ